MTDKDYDKFGYKEGDIEIKTPSKKQKKTKIKKGSKK